MGRILAVCRLCEVPYGEVTALKLSGKRAVSLMPRREPWAWESQGVGSRPLWHPLAGKSLPLWASVCLLNKWVKTVCSASFCVMAEGLWQGLGFAAKQTWFLKQSFNLPEHISSFVK